MILKVLFETVKEHFEKFKSSSKNAPIVIIDYLVIVWLTFYCSSSSK